MHSERPAHRMYDQYQPLGIVGIISAFNFPVAVWSWNAMLAAVCGDVSIWKPSEKTPLTAVAVQHIIKRRAGRKRHCRRRVQRHHRRCRRLAPPWPPTSACR